MNEVKDILLESIARGTHDNRPFPSHTEAHYRRNGGGKRERELVEVIDPARSSMDLMILQLAVSGEIAPTKLVEIYPDINDLRHYLVVTRENLEVVKRKELADGINDLMILRMCAIAGWD